MRPVNGAESFTSTVFGYLSANAPVSPLAPSDVGNAWTLSVTANRSSLDAPPDRLAKIPDVKMPASRISNAGGCILNFVLTLCSLLEMINHVAAGVGGGAVDGGDAGAEQTQVDDELSAMMRGMV